MNILDSKNIDLIKELGLENLSADKQAEFLLKIGRIIQQNIILRILNELKEEDKDEFDKMLETKMNDEEAVLNFLRLKIPNVDLIVSEEIEKFKKESVNLMRNLKV